MQYTTFMGWIFTHLYQSEAFLTQLTHWGERCWIAHHAGGGIWGEREDKACDGDFVLCIQMDVRLSIEVYWVKIGNMWVGWREGKLVVEMKDEDTHTDELVDKDKLSLVKDLLALFQLPENVVVELDLLLLENPCFVEDAFEIYF